MAQEIVEKITVKVRKGFNHKRFEELKANPPKELYCNNDVIWIDDRIFRKLCQYVYNMVFKNQDFMGLFGGKEGTGKSTDASQIGYQIYYIYTECNVLREDLGLYYEWNLDECCGHNLTDYMKLITKYDDKLFRIFICDEAGGLKGEEHFEEGNKLFRDNMRKDRKKLRCQLICYPQPFELVKAMTKGRINMYRISKFRKDKKKGSIPDIVDTMIVPRTGETFSYHTNEIVSERDIHKFLETAHKEKYNLNIPKKYVYATSKKNSTFCFETEKYMKDAKERNKLYVEEDKIFISNKLQELFALHLTPAKLGLRTKLPKDLKGDDLKEAEREVKDSLLINKLKFKCKEAVAKRKKNLEYL